ncbi:hypothetical protein [[Mycoplasma] anseris]|uniref:Uncharacterized protein n=1 Tax=[Mycoplasma] anseris TaxID=92400 RepID=A0A2Z4NC98_9BACT|nr:hypothetical protein [[Mycoplasma] anseris]AWX69181.1 hypothetical protein DP065_00150 [[Mycoplasma] anseris]
MSKSKKLAIVALILNPLGFIIALVGFIFLILAGIGIANSTNDPNVAGFSLLVAGVGTLVAILVGSALSFTSLVISIIAAVKTTNSTAMILTLVGLFVLPILAWVGLGMIIKENNDK